MNMQRTTGMTTIGVLNIVFGALGALLSLFIVLGGGLLAAGGLASESSGEGQGMGTAVAAGGGMLVLIGMLSMLCSAALTVSGIGVLKMAHWGRTLAMASGGILALMNLYSLMTSGFGLFTVGFMIYGGMLVGLFCMPEWKAAFTANSSSQSADTAADMASQDNMRRAA